MADDSPTYDSGYPPPPQAAPPIQQVPPPPPNPLNLPWPSNFKVAVHAGPVCWAPAAQAKFNLTWKEMYTNALPCFMPEKNGCGENGEFVRVAEADCLMLASALGKYKEPEVGNKRDRDEANGDGDDTKKAKTENKENGEGDKDAEEEGEKEEVWVSSLFAFASVQACILCVFVCVCARVCENLP